MTTAATSSGRNVNPLDLRYTPVAQESDLSYVRGFLSTLPASERPTDSVVAQIGKEGTIKAQLVYLKNASLYGTKDLPGKEALCGVIVYEQKPKAIQLYLVRTTNDAIFSGKGISRHMLYKITKLAKELNCLSISAAVNIADPSSIRFFEKNEFALQATSTSQEAILIKNLAEDADEKKRPALAAAPQTPVTKAARQTPVAQKAMEVPLKQQYLALIKNGRKTVEGRIAAGMFANIAQGTKIRFFNQQDQVTCLVTKVTKYGSFAEMLRKEGVEKCLPGSTVDDGIRIYDSLPGYKERAQRSGVFAIQVKVDGNA